MVEGWDGPIAIIPASDLLRGTIFSRLLACIGLLRACLASRRELKRTGADVMLAMGSYASVGPVLAARWLGIPAVLHEANAIPGKAIGFLSRFARRVGITFSAAATYLPDNKTVLTGLPLYHALARRPAKNPEPGTPFKLLVMGGSQGAQRINEILPAAISRLHTDGVALEVTHLSGESDANAVERQYSDSGVPHRVMPFCADMPSLYAAADLAICRSGAATCIELATCGLPAVLIPYPRSSRDHQLLNARELEVMGGARVMEQPDLTEGLVVDYIAYCIDHPKVLQVMRESMSILAIPGADEKLADLVEGCVQEHHPAKNE
jgi:UDP-N-acetylglucosamine--N-acetylmuramyl-(pentapeptide) pyrophosphoryl-undecaprenol N-acetylglucosamine transferase